ncbi:MAG: CopG family transcriptional regulator, partial [Candidatus Aminicenantes bacterium]|nr:CopG family transcriptional regulator [Candidatus Aminicenantes bacterium]
DFVIYVLRDLASARDGVDTMATKDEKELSKEEIEAIRKRLKTLGYL